jgi:cyclopropane fatty-acyl-phospholipid synthase-like methyltransferase
MLRLCGPWWLSLFGATMLCNVNQLGSHYLMSKEFDLYDGHYGHLATDPQVEVRRETYGEDLGQASWITVEEARAWFDLLRLGRGQRALEVACGSGGVTCAMASSTGAECVGVDINSTKGYPAEFASGCVL